MDSDLAIGTLKIASVLIGAALGIAGLLANYRDTYGKLSRAGIAVLAGMIISAVVGVATTSVESYKSRQSNKEQAERTETLLRQLSRAVLPIKELRTTYWLEVPASTEGVEKYIKRLDQGIAERHHILGLRSKIAGNQDERARGLEAWAIQSNGEPLNVKITKESDLWPQTDEIELSSLEKLFPLHIDIFRTPIVPERHYPMHGSSDLGAWALFADRLALDWDIEKKRLSIVGTTTFDKKLWKNNGKIAAISDLYGAQILLKPPDTKEAIDNLAGVPARTRPNPVMKALIPRTVNLDFGDGLTYWIRGKKISKTTNARGETVYGVVFPSKEDEFLAFTRSSDD